MGNPCNQTTKLCFIFSDEKVIHHPHSVGVISTAFNRKGGKFEHFRCSDSAILLLPFANLVHAIWCNHHFSLFNHKAWISKWFLNSGFRFGFWSFWILMENNFCDTVGSVSQARDICFSQFMLNNNVDHVGHRQISNQTKNMLILSSEHMWWWVQDRIRNAYFLNLCVFIPSRINCVAFSFCLYCESRTVSEYILNKHRTVN